MTGYIRGVIIKWKIKNKLWINMKKYLNVWIRNR